MKANFLVRVKVKQGLCFEKNRGAGTIPYLKAPLFLDLGINSQSLNHILLSRSFGASSLFPFTTVLITSHLIRDRIGPLLFLFMVTEEPCSKHRKSQRGKANAWLYFSCL